MLGSMKQSFLGNVKPTYTPTPGWMTGVSLTNTAYGDSIYVEGSDIDSSGNVYVAGSVNIGSPKRALQITKLLANGSLAWNAFYQASWLTLGASGIDTVVDTTGNVYVVGVASDYGQGSGTDDNKGHGVLLKFNNSGTLTFQQFISDSNGLGLYPDAVDITPDQNYVYVLGRIQLPTAFGTNYGPIVLKYDTSGGLIWATGLTITGGAGFDVNSPTALSVSQDGNIYVSGSYTASSIVNALVWKLNSSGTVYWEKTFGSETFGVTDIKIKPTSTDSGAILTGGASIGNYVPVVNIDQNSNIVWQNFIGDERSSYSEYGLNIAVDAQQNAYGTFYSSDGIDGTLYKYNSGGGLIWTNDLTNVSPSILNQNQALAINNAAKTILWSSGAGTGADLPGMRQFTANLDAYGTGVGTYILGANVTTGNTVPYATNTYVTSITGNLTVSTISGIGSTDLTSSVVNSSGNLTTYTSGTLMTLSNTSVTIGSRR